MTVQLKRLLGRTMIAQPSLVAEGMKNVPRSLIPYLLKMLLDLRATGSSHSQTAWIQEIIVSYITLHI